MCISCKKARFRFIFPTKKDAKDKKKERDRESAGGNGCATMNFKSFVGFFFHFLALCIKRALILLLCRSVGELSHSSKESEREGKLADGKDEERVKTNDDIRKRKRKNNSLEFARTNGIWLDAHCFERAQVHTRARLQHPPIWFCSRLIQLCKTEISVLLLE